LDHASAEVGLRTKDHFAVLPKLLTSELAAVVVVSSSKRMAVQRRPLLLVVGAALQVGVSGPALSVDGLRGAQAHDRQVREVLKGCWHLKVLLKKVRVRWHKKHV
jgi:hypothetical protein